MNKAIANILKEKMIGLPFLSKIGGMVQVAEFQESVEVEGSETPSTVIKRIPITCDVNYVNGSYSNDFNDDYDNDDKAACDSKVMNPDKKHRGILYFEDNGLTLANDIGRFFSYRSSLRLVCWINTDWIKNDSCIELSALLINKIIALVKELNLKNVDHFIRLTPVIEKIPKQDKTIFSPYTYDILNTQYLLPPYEYFAIDLIIDFLINKNSCIPEIEMKTNEDFYNSTNCS